MRLQTGRFRRNLLRNPRMTEAVQDAVSGPPIAGSPDRAEWETARGRRAGEPKAAASPVALGRGEPPRNTPGWPAA